MKYFIWILALLCHTITLSGQLSQSQIDTSDKALGLRMCSSLITLGNLAQQDNRDADINAAQRGMLIRSDGKVYLQIAEGWDASVGIDLNPLTARGIEIQDHYRNVAGVWLNPVDFIDIAKDLPETYLLRSAARHTTDHEGILVTNALDYKNVGGANGQGVTIAVIDAGGYQQLTAAQNAGTAPDPPAATYDWTGTGLQTGNTHGTGCTEIIFEYAPSATYYLHKITGESQLGLAINQAILDGVDLISCSTSFFNTGWPDGSGVPCAAVKDATDAGIVYFHGVGNFNDKHYQSTFLSTDGDDWHEVAPGDETNELVVANNATVNANLQWTGTPSSTNDFDLYLFNKANGNTLASGTTTTDFESISWTNTTGSTVTAEIAILRFNSSNIHFEVFVPSGPTLQFNQTGNSSASPSNSLEDLCITVGAINQNQYGNASPSAEFFSSRGPTNNGRIVPDLIAPDGVTLVSYPNKFFGSSAGGPNTCGLTAVLWSEHDYLSATGVVELVKGLAGLYNDWGVPGKDTVFGEGGIYLPDFTANSRFIDKGANNTGGLTTLPFYDIEQADALAPANSNVFYLGGTHAVPAGIITAPMIYRSLKNNATIKP